MNQEDIKLVLSFCKPDISAPWHLSVLEGFWYQKEQHCKVDLKYFQVSKVFEAIYRFQVYTSEVVDRLFRIACYKDKTYNIE